ncbi:MAG: archaeosortase/exosortase family protein [Verrucomicrobia bacterium]|nr:archaeosortase/exosortase family protein [Verrucomicrobiota bacterium]MDE3098035.1 archaeosortase/exosortase family protein [Verrucomicrobiota bacterium]
MAFSDHQGEFVKNAPLQAATSSIPAGSAQARNRWRAFLLALAILLLAFCVPLFQLARFAAASQLYSYVLLVPFISAWLVWIKRATLPLSARPMRFAGAIFLALGIAVMAAWLLAGHPGGRMARENGLTLQTLSFVLDVFALVFLFWGKDTVRAVRFPLFFLLFMVPLPPSLVLATDSFLQYGSAQVARLFFGLSGMAFLQDGLTFQLPDISLHIAPECSGIHSTIVLFITSLLAAYLLLRTTWKRALFVLFVIPLGLIRNGFRVFVIGELCVHIGPQMINSPIHRKGGPIFFVLSLIPLFLLLIALQKSERARSGTKK